MQNRLSKLLVNSPKAAYGAFALVLADISVGLAATTEMAGDEASSGGLPQLDPSTYPSQIFWLIIAFALLYYFFSSKTLPEVSSVLENRKDRIANDLSTADQLKQEIDSAQSTYENSLRGARDEATKVLAATNAKNAEKAAKEAEKFRAKADKDIAAIEQDINKAKADAMDDMNVIVAEVSKEAAQKIVGLKDLDIKKAQTVVKALNRKKAA